MKNNRKQHAKRKIIKFIWRTAECKFIKQVYLSLYGSEINATLVKPEPESFPITSNTLP